MHSLISVIPTIVLVPESMAACESSTYFWQNTLARIGYMNAITHLRAQRGLRDVLIPFYTVECSFDHPIVRKKIRLQEHRIRQKEEWKFQTVSPLQHHTLEGHLVSVQIVEDRPNTMCHSNAVSRDECHISGLSNSTCTPTWRKLCLTEERIRCRQTKSYRTVKAGKPEWTIIAPKK